MSRKLTTADFITKARSVHGERYDYSKVEYTGAFKKITIICRDHGEFEQNAGTHSSGAGCPQCARIISDRSKLIDTKTFVEKARSVHGERYDYSKVEYVESKSPVTIICREHGEFKQTPNYHLQTGGCQKCGLISGRKLDTDEFIEKARSVHEDRYDYSKVVYVDTKTKITITCKVHGDFKQIAANHLQKQGCPKCGLISKLKLDTDEFIKRALETHGDKYEYTKTVYVQSELHVVITCKVHGDFKQIARNHLQSAGCPKCGNSGPSKAELEILEFVQSLCPDAIGSDRKEIAPFELDIFVPSKRVAIEHHGLIWHSDKYAHKNSHLNKLKLCQSSNIDLIQIYADEWENKQDIVKSLIASRLGVYEQRHYARKTQLKAVPTHIARSFYNDNHMQGYAHAKEHYGLYVDDALLSMASFAPQRSILTNKSTHDLELVRFVNKINTQVVGGFSKLLTAAKARSIITYCDRRLFNGMGYRSVGFNWLRDSQPSYYYTTGREREMRFKYQKHKLQSILETFDPNKSEGENMSDNGFYRIYDCGNQVFELI